MISDIMAKGPDVECVYVCPAGGAADRGLAVANRVMVLRFELGAVGNDQEHQHPAIP